MALQDLAGSALQSAGKNVIPGIAGKAVSAVGGLLKGESPGHRENLFFDHRDAVFATLRGNSWTPESEWAPIAASYKFAHKQVNDWQLGTYDEEFNRLHQFVREYLNKKKAGLGDAFWAKAWQIAAELEKSVPDPSRSYKGAANEGLQWALANRNNVNVTEILNTTDGLGIGQPYVDTKTGQIVVPSTQQGEGIFSQLNNYASAQLNKIGGQVVSTVAANISGQQQIAAGGGVTLTGGATIGNPVTKNTTASNSSSDGSGNILFIVFVAIALIFSGALKKLFR